ncbi:type II secretion system F family protein [Persephonella sp.]
MAAVNLKDLLVYFEILASNEGDLPFVSLLQFAAKAVPPSFRKKAEMIANAVEAGTPFAKALSRAGVDRLITKQIEGFEEQGQIEEGVKATLDILRQQYEIERTKKKVDREIYIIVGIILVNIAVAGLYFIPNFVQKIVLTVGTREQIKRDPILNFMVEIYGDFSLYKGLIAFAIVALFAYTLFAVLKIHRFFIKILPIGRKIEQLNDKIIFYKIMLLAQQEAEAMRQIKRIFGKKYNFHRVYEVFLSNPWDFSLSTLFTKEEKDLLRSVGMTASRGSLKFLLKEAIRERDEAVEKLTTYTGYIQKILIILSVFALYGMIFTMYSRLQNIM